MKGKRIDISSTVRVRVFSHVFSRVSIRVHDRVFSRVFNCVSGRVYKTKKVLK